jgi:hypothetical protein
MANDEIEVEAEINSKGLNAPRLRPEDIDAVIAGEYSFRVSDVIGRGAPVLDGLACLTICVLVLRNGFTVVGKSACVSPANYDADLGHKIARADARSQIWALEGYRLRSRLTDS